jgi:DNA-binding NarL/FixJ family response regulator
MVTLVIADDHTLVRKGLRALLAPHVDVHVVGEATDGIEAVEVSVRMRPDVLLVAHALSRMNGVEVTRQVRKSAPHTRVAVVSPHDDESRAAEALRAGASAYVLLDSTADELVRALRDVSLGRLFVSARVAERASSNPFGDARCTPDDAYETLTRREREVLHLAAEGARSAQVAERLGISPRTVEVHRANVMRKLGLRSQVDLIRFALRKGIIPMDGGS